jgi:hypothetical protein
LASKNPATPNGFYDAVTDETEIKNLWRADPGCLIGVRTGLHFDALDLDPQAKDWFEHNRRRLPQTRIHRTRRGGLHVLFAHHEAVRCTASKIAAGVDTRGTGGYLIWWPAARLPVLSDAPLAPWPEWLLAELRPKPRVVPSNTIVHCGGDRWLRGLVRTVVLLKASATRSCSGPHAVPAKQYTTAKLPKISSLGSYSKRQRMPGSRCGKRSKQFAVGYRDHDDASKQRTNKGYG